MSGRWFRLYDDTINEPKVLKLSDKTFRVWIGILCIASKNDGALPPFEDMAIMLRMKPEKLQPELETLIKSELLDHDDDGLRPHNWNTRQYKSDVSTDRVKRFRNAERNVSETPPETEADTENRKKEKPIERSPKATRSKSPEAFEEFWKAYPRRLGANPKAPACKVFDAAVRQGADPSAIIEGARRCAAADHDKIGTPYIPQASKWLRDRRWEDYAAGPPGESGLSEADRKKLFEELRNGRVEEKGSDLRPTGASPRKIEGNGRQEPAAIADDQIKRTGMARMGDVFPESSGVRAGGHEAGPNGVE